MPESSTYERGAGHTEQVEAGTNTDLRSLRLGLEQRWRGPRRAHGASEAVVRRSRDNR